MKVKLIAHTPEPEKLIAAAAKVCYSISRVDQIMENLFNKRCCMRAQDEIRSVANEMLSQCREVAPVLFKNAGAPCVGGECPEKEMGCQK